ncbi:O-antigen ligase family protein [Moorena producens]|uniref:O-antigen ligase family protein n=1 Tax=Moorena producens TaxID=1155739 RepID=UPI003C76EF80
MEIHNPSHRYSTLTFWLGLAGVPIGLAVGLLAATQPSLLGLGLVAVAVVVYFFARFEQAVLGLLILRSSLDIFSDQGIPAAFAVGLIGLTLLYVTVRLLTGQIVHTDKFWWLLAGWVVLQGLWVVLLPLGGLGLDGSYFSTAIREWVRLFSWPMVYLLVMQLKDRLPPQTVINLLFIGLVMPLTVASIQILLPDSLLPDLIKPSGYSLSASLEVTARINGTLGHSNTFTTFLFLFLGLTYWKQNQAQQSKPWLLLLGVLAFFFVSTKALFGLMMLAAFIVFLIGPRLSLLNLIAGIVLFALMIGLFGSTEFGQERLGSIAQTPLGNPDIDIWKAILLSQGDGNSFNWRLAQWTYLLEQWKHFPILGYGLGTNKLISSNGLEPHNDYIRALVEGGIIGLLTFFTFFGIQIVRLVQLIRSATSGSQQRTLCLTLLPILLAIPVGMLTDNIWTHTTLFFYWWTLLAIAGWNWNKPNTEQNTIDKTI